MANIPGTNVPAISFGPNGFVAPPAPDLLAGMQADVNAAFGKTLNFQLTTPQGQLTTSWSASVDNFNGLFVYYTQQVDPAYATGRMQDAIARIYFLERLAAQPTVLQVACFGATNLLIPEGATVQDSAGNLYACTQAGNIGAGGSVTLPFAALVAGATAVPASVTIYQTLLGWDSASVSSGTVGRATETRQEFEDRRAATVAGNSFGASGSVAGAVAKVAGVTDFYVQDNPLSSPVTVQGQVLAANSIYVCASGGTDLDVAQAILSKKSAGCNYTGSTTVTAFDSNPLYSAPIPYSVSFQRPANSEVVFAVTLSNNSLVPSNAVALVQAAVANAFAGLDGGPRARIGGKILATRFVAPIEALGPWAQVLSILLGSTQAPTATFTASVAGAAMTVSAVATGTLALGQTVIAPGILVGTTISAFGSGGGGTGTYTLSQAQGTVGSEAMSSVLPSLTSIVVNINLQPTTAAADVGVVIS